MGAPSDIRVDDPIDGVAVVTIDRPAKANTITDASHRRLAEVWPELEADPAVNVVVLTGSGTVFCGGGDMNGWKRLIEDRAYRRMKLAEARAIIVNMLRCELPIVAAVNGPAIGLGSSLAVACDVMFMSADAYLADTHVPHGLVAGDGGAALLPALLPVPVARRMLLTGERLSAETAAQWGLAEQVIEPGRAFDRAFEFASGVAALSPDAVRLTKRAINGSLLAQVLGALETSAAGQAGSFDTDYYRDRVNARNRETAARPVRTGAS